MLPWISSLWHSQHWAEITLCQHTRTYLHNALFLLNSPIPLVSFSSELNIMMLKNQKKSELPHPSPNFKTPVLQSHTLSQTYGAILPTSLTYFLLQHQRLLTLETCCGHWYGRLWIIQDSRSCIPFVFQGSIANMSLHSQRLEMPNSPPTPSSLIDSIQRICVRIFPERNRFQTSFRNLKCCHPKLPNNI